MNKLNIESIRKEFASGKTIYDIGLRVTYYARVSSDTEEQASSIVNQEEYFISLIKDNKHWIYVEGYTDEGVSGKNVLKRENFLRMIDDASLDKFDLVLTKSVPRFARNTLDSIKYTELLFSYNIGVYFLNDNISTFMPDSEFRLTLMASIAQDDLRKLSQNVKFGLAQSIKRGVVLGSNNIYGYNKYKGKLSIIKEEAIIINTMYLLYNVYHSYKKTYSSLIQKGYFNRQNKPFCITTIKRILKNPKYKGYYCGNKTKTINYKTGIKENVSKDKWIMYKDYINIPPIIDDTLWNDVNNYIGDKEKLYMGRKRPNSSKLFSSLLVCYEHNTYYTRTGAKTKRKTDYRYWSCSLYKKGIKYCESPLIKEDILIDLFTNLISNKIINKNSIINSLFNKYRDMFDKSNKNKESQLNGVLSDIEHKKKALLDLFLSNYITKEEFNNKNMEYDNIILRNKQLINDLTIEPIVKCNNLFIKDALKKEFNIRDNLKVFINVFIDNVLIKKIDNNRKLLNLIITYKTGDIETIKLSI
ncbi:MAG: recombinase family protein [Bacilli bacterium]